MVGCVQGLIGSYKAAGAPPPVSGRTCTSGDVALGCCKVTSICAPDGVGSGATCSPVATEGNGWDYNC